MQVGLCMKCLREGVTSAGGRMLEVYEEHVTSAGGKLLEVQEEGSYSL